MSPSVSPALTSREMAILVEMLQSERNRLLVQIRHTDHRVYRDALCDRLKVVEDLAQRLERTPA